MSEKNQFVLLKSVRFFPLFLTQFLGALHDNVFKNAMVVLLLFATTQPEIDGSSKFLSSIAAGVFILPYVLFSALGGQLADHFPKYRVIRTIKLIEMFIALLGVVALWTTSLPLLFLTLFALGTHSAIFSPSKYAIVSVHLQRDELIGGNALLNTGVFLAVLIGTMMGTALITLPAGKAIVGGIILAVAIIGYVASRYIPADTASDSKTPFVFNPIHEIRAMLALTFGQSRAVVLSVMGISWFYLMGGMLLAQMPSFVHDTLHASEHVLTILLALFSVGIAGGSLLNNKLLRGRIDAVYVPLAILGLSLFIFDLYLASANATGSLTLRVAFDVVMISICGGLLVVPLNAIIQSQTDATVRPIILAGNSFMNAIFMVLSALVSVGLISLGFDVRGQFIIFAAANVCVAIYICRILPDYLFKSLLQALFKTLYQVEVRGLENIEKAGKRAVIVGNHVSLLDPPLLAAFLPGRPMFAVNSFVANWWWVKPFLRLVDYFPMDPTNPFSIRALIRKVEENRHIVIFPEGRLTETGALMKIYDGPGMIADKADAVILPVRLDGVQHTPFARLKGRVPLRSFPKITITILEPRVFKIKPELTGQERREAAARQLYDLMEDMMFLTGDRQQTLYQALLRAGHVNGNDATIVEDVGREPMKFRRLVQSSMIMGRQISRFSQKGENIGIMLPNSIGAVVTFFAMQAFGRVPAMLNYSVGSRSILSACRTAQIKTVITSRRFVEMGKLESITDALGQHVNVLYLEDIKARVGWADKLWSALVSPDRAHRAVRVDPAAPAVVLFTSGSEGEPKGVVLSHENLMTNVVQMSARVDFNRQDVVFNCLPMFHSFGLTGGMLLPILSGVSTFMYPSPLHYRIVPEMVYSSNATIMFGTDTFLRGYARVANPYDFYRMRYIFAGAEKVREETKQTYMSKFGVRIFEGYGATETSPVIAVNSPMFNATESVGKFLSGINYRLDPVPGIDVGGRLYVHGPNVMLGYYKAENPGVIQPTEGGWHDTGDIVSIDDQGFVRILGRAKRFAKIAGEMVSLRQAEEIAEVVWPEHGHAVVALPDLRKGEQLVLVTTQTGAQRSNLSAYATANGLTPLVVPAVVIVVDKLPVLGSGKVDYVAVKAIVDQKIVLPDGVNDDEDGEQI